MTPAARSVQIFGLYLCLLGPGLVLIPGPLLAPFAIAAPMEIWVRVAGLLAGLLGIYYLVAARHELTPLIRASVWGRAAVLPLFAGLVAFHGAPVALMVFGAVDAAAALWTGLALRRPHALAA